METPLAAEDDDADADEDDADDDDADGGDDELNDPGGDDDDVLVLGTTELLFGPVLLTLFGAVGFI